MRLGFRFTPDAVTLAATSGQTPLDHALGDGEDFELIFTTSPEDAEKLHAEPHAIRIGECTADGLGLRTAGGVSPLSPKGWVHTFSDEG